MASKRRGPYRHYPLALKRAIVEETLRPGASVIGSAKLNGLDPEAYLCFVIAQIADYRINELDDLLPWRVAEQIANTEHHAAA